MLVVIVIMIDGSKKIIIISFVLNLNVFMLLKVVVKRFKIKKLFLWNFVRVFYENVERFYG